MLPGHRMWREIEAVSQQSRVNLHVCICTSWLNVHTDCRQHWLLKLAWGLRCGNMMSMLMINFSWSILPSWLSTTYLRQWETARATGCRPTPQMFDRYYFQAAKSWNDRGYWYLRRKIQRFVMHQAAEAKYGNKSGYWLLFDEKIKLSAKESTCDDYWGGASMMQILERRHRW